MSNVKKSEYLVFADHRFSGMADGELKAIFPDVVFEERSRHGSVSLLTVGMKMDASEVASALRKRKPSFIDFAMPIDARLERVGGDYRKVSKAIAGLLGKQRERTFKIEVRRIDTNMEEGAKSIEVALGRKLEGSGFHADLEKPEIMVYVVFLKNAALIGHAETSKDANQVLDRFRFEGREPSESVSRAEFKMKEAVEFFGINLKNVRKSLDIGAAPGGWTHYLSRQGIQIVAVDNALLDYRKLAEGKRILVLAGRGEVPRLRKMAKSLKLGAGVAVSSVAKGAGLDSYDIIHLKANMRKSKTMKALMGFGKFDMLTIDTNTSPTESASIANALAALMRPKAPLVMTAKLVTKSFNSHVKAATGALSESYRSIRVKKLPHDRRELTVYALLKDKNKRHR
jgi:23S rRNA C2498 (ribose-2'-O)-methylase RlmM